MDQEKKNIYILREAKAKFKNVGILWGADNNGSAILVLGKRAFFGKIPFPVIYLSGDEVEAGKLKEKVAKEWAIDLLVVKAGELKKTVEDHKFEALVVPKGFATVNLPNVSYIEIDLKKKEGGEIKDQEKEEVMQRLRELGYL